MIQTKRKLLSFEERLAQLVEFKNRFGHTNVPKRWEENIQLSNWVISQRYLYKSQKLEADRIAALQQLSFSFSRIHDPVEDALIRLDTLKRYRAEMNSTLGIPSRNDLNDEYASFAAWLHRLRRLHRGGKLPEAVIELLSKENISLDDVSATSSYVGGIKLEKDSFDTNHQNFSDWLSQRETQGFPRDLTYRDSKESKQAERSYRFIEHMLTKARHGVLPGNHRESLINLSCSINGKPISEVLNPMPSIRSVDGAAISDAERDVNAAKLRAQIAQTQADRIAMEAAELIAEANRRTQEALIRARKATQEADLIEANARERIEQNKFAAIMPPANRENEYITTEELSVRIKYDPRTIRERLKDKVFIFGVHYVNSIGRKILYIWNKIEADMLAGKFQNIDV